MSNSWLRPQRNNNLFRPLSTDCPLGVCHIGVRKIYDRESLIACHTILNRIDRSNCNETRFIFFHIDTETIPNTKTELLLCSCSSGLSSSKHLDGCSECLQKHSKKPRRCQHPFRLVNITFLVDIGRESPCIFQTSWETWERLSLPLPHTFGSDNKCVYSFLISLWETLSFLFLFLFFLQFRRTAHIAELLLNRIGYRYAWKTLPRSTWMLSIYTYIYTYIYIHIYVCVCVYRD